MRSTALCNLEYSAVIRTFNSAATLPLTLGSLRSQTKQPNRYIFVDSGSTDNSLQSLPNESSVHKFVGPEFNYSEALNQGINLASTAYVLLISSHIEIKNREAIEYALGLVSANETIAAAYFGGAEEIGPLRSELIDKRNFTGFNGLWNSCALIKLSWLRERGFRREVFSAEDQEWANWVFSVKNGAIACIYGAGAMNNNPRRASRRKWLNEQVSIAYFTNPKLLSPLNIAHAIFTAINPISGRSLESRLSYLVLTVRLIACRFCKPKGRSCYF